MADKPAQEKTETATPRKLNKAREEGQVARSMELNSVVIVCFGFVSLYLLGPMMYDSMSGIMRYTLSNAPAIAITPDKVQLIFADRIATFAQIAAPAILLIAVFAFGINVVQTGWMVSFKSLQPKFDKLDVIKGIGRLISKKSLITLIRDVIKTVVIAIVAYQTIDGWMPDLITIGDKTAGQYGQILGKLALMLAIKICVVLFILAMFDFAYQRWDFANNQKMTKQEVREEMKDTDGNPQLKSHIKQVQREMAQRRMMSEIPEADVVVTNPTHYAVALKYDVDTMSAPKVVAKGQRLIAQKIKKIAKEKGIPIVENKPLARSLFKLVDVGAYIPNELFKAVAEVLAYIYRVKSNGGVANA
ncbi:MAG: flagellar biosynthesis protein FlhB [candidate division Zixibacteria bacterium]|nr:flagellar biosynthesis protein FlhB [candidate division Zixibacteria bacterium]